MTPEPDLIETALAGFGNSPTRPPRFPLAEVSYAVHDTPVGRILLAGNASGTLVASIFTPDSASEDAVLKRLATRISPRVLRRSRAVDQARAWLDDFLGGRHPGPPPPWSLALASSFQVPVLATLAERVGYGHRASYGQLAAWAGRPGAARAVGAALRANPLCIVLPCHRIVASSGGLTGYAGGLAAKRFLLDLEADRLR